MGLLGWFIAFIVSCILALWSMWHFYRKGQRELKKMYSQKKSSEVRTGQIAENWAPFLKQCEDLDPKTMRFMGDPIDFIVYDLENDRIVFMEIKSGNAKLSDKQKHIKELIKKGNVEWREVRIK